MSRLFCFGLGYTARRLARVLLTAGWRVAGTSRTADGCAALAAEGIEAHRFDSDYPIDDSAALDGTTHLVTSIPPDKGGDPVLRHHGAAIGALSALEWVGYLSATSVYGDTGGAWVDETAICAPTTDRGRGRVAAEAEWLARFGDTGLPVHIFRLAGIYGAGRSAFDQIRSGRARRIDRPDHLFSRIHVDDIVKVLRASMTRPAPGTVYNVCDDTPAASADVLAFAADLLGIDPPPLVDFDDAGLSPMARSFYADNRLVSNKRTKSDLGVVLDYPDFRGGLRGVLEQEASG
ncbi:MAG: SDR family oxidoreductase [Proteobacteria bacterium]|nr:SDR family oxidoreductase [Pseudomonadota bacterium]